MKQIILSEYRKEDTNSIIGKTVKDISYVSGESTIESQLIIIFTDDTYIYLTVDIDEYAENRIKNGKVIPLQHYSYPPGNVIVDKDGNKIFKYRKNIEDQIRLGLVKPDREKELEKIKAYEECSNKREYALYLELKKKFEH